MMILGDQARVKRFAGMVRRRNPTHDLEIDFAKVHAPASPTFVMLTCRSTPRNLGKTGRGRKQKPLKTWHDMTFCDTAGAKGETPRMSAPSAAHPASGR